MLLFKFNWLGATPIQLLILIVIPNCSVLSESHSLKICDKQTTFTLHLVYHTSMDSAVISISSHHMKGDCDSKISKEQLNLTPSARCQQLILNCHIFCHR